MEQVRIGIIGAGAISKRHLNGYRQLPNVKVCSICDVNEATAKTRAQEFGIEKYFTDAMDIITDPEIDAVSIVTPTFTHKDLVIAALENGKHVLCEKPPALNAKEAAMCEEVAKKTGKLLMYGFVVRFNKDTTFLKDYIATGALGKIYYVELARIARAFRIGGWFVNKELSGGGALIDSVIHQLDMALYLMGHPKVHSVKGFASREIAGLPYKMKGVGAGWNSADTNSYSHEVESLAGGLIRFEDGTSLYLKTSWALNTTKPTKFVELCGTEGGAILENGSIKLVTVDESGYYLESTPVLRDEFVGFDREIAHFVDCCTGKTECICKPEQGTQIMQIIDAIYESAETGKEVIF